MGKKDQYLVKAIIDRKDEMNANGRKSTYYKVLWEGYPQEQATWQSLYALYQSPQVKKQIQAFNQKRKEIKKQSKDNQSQKSFISKTSKKETKQKNLHKSKLGKQNLDTSAIQFEQENTIVIPPSPIQIISQQIKEPEKKKAKSSQIATQIIQKLRNDIKTPKQASKPKKANKQIIEQKSDKQIVEQKSTKLINKIKEKIIPNKQKGKEKDKQKQKEKQPLPSQPQKQSVQIVAQSKQAAQSKQIKTLKQKYEKKVADKIKNKQQKVNTNKSNAEGSNNKKLKKVSQKKQSDSVSQNKTAVNDTLPQTQKYLAPIVEQVNQKTKVNPVNTNINGNSAIYSTINSILNSNIKPIKPINSVNAVNPVNEPLIISQNNSIIQQGQNFLSKSVLDERNNICQHIKLQLTQEIGQTNNMNNSMMGPIRYNSNEMVRQQREEEIQIKGMMVHSDTGEYLYLVEGNGITKIISRPQILNSHPYELICFYEGRINIKPVEISAEVLSKLASS